MSWCRWRGRWKDERGEGLVRVLFPKGDNLEDLLVLRGDGWGREGHTLSVNQSFFNVSISSFITVLLQPFALN